MVTLDAAHGLSGAHGFDHGLEQPSFIAASPAEFLGFVRGYLGPQSCSISAAMVFIKPSRTIPLSWSRRILVAWLSSACANACRMLSSGVVRMN
jgi:hypothetical protein